MPRSRRKTPQNVILIGFMGSGKTTVGRLIARSLGFEFVDTDAMVVERAGKPITEIFAEVGEAGFRALEAEVVAELAGLQHHAIATGGGIVTQKDNVEALRAAGMVVWLDASAEETLRRVEGNDERPLLKTADPLGTIREMLATRRPLYEAAADLRIGSAGLDPDEMAYGLAESVRVWFGARGD